MKETLTYHLRENWGLLASAVGISATVTLYFHIIDIVVGSLTLIVSFCLAAVKLWIKIEHARYLHRHRNDQWVMKRELERVRYRSQRKQRRAEDDEPTTIA